MMYKVTWMDGFKIVKREKVDHSTALQLLMNEGWKEHEAEAHLNRTCPYMLVTEEGYLLKIKKA